MIFKNLFLAISVILFFGCGPTYLPAIWDSSPPLSSPLEVKGSARFISGYYNDASGFNEGEENKFFRMTITEVRGGSWYKIGVSGFAYLGNYNASASNRGTKSYFGVGSDLDANVFFSLLSIMNIGAGVYGGIAGEFGEYTALRKEMGIEWKPAELIPFSAIYYFIQFNFSKNDKLAFRMAFGLPGAISSGISFYTKYGGFWVGLHGEKFEATSVGFSIKIK